MKETYIEIDNLIMFCKEVFKKNSICENDASIAADVLVSADRRGISSHGVARLQRYIYGIDAGMIQPNAEPKILVETPVSLLVDAQGGLGAPVSNMVMNKTLEKADKVGMAFSCIKNSNHYGIAAYYAMKALDKDMMGVCMTNTAALGVPTFGRDVMFGTNPLAFAAPAGEEGSFVLDMATTVVTRGKIEVYNRQEMKLPSGWAVDKDGNSASEPAPLLQDMYHRKGGGISPLGGDSELFGGHKGYGLAVMVDILTGVLSGSAFGADLRDTEVTTGRVSHCFGAMKIDLFQDSKTFRKSMDKMLGELRAMVPADGKERVYFAGLKEMEAEKETENTGIPLTPKVWKSLNEIAQKYNLESYLIKR